MKTSTRVDIRRVSRRKRNRTEDRRDTGALEKRARAPRYKNPLPMPSVPPLKEDESKQQVSGTNKPLKNSRGIID